MPKQVKNMIPLLCDLCPKKPRFSDVSHLLTHISSKSHLSNRFKLQIRSQAEPEAKRLLSEFDNWYSGNGLEDLLSERLSAKEQKRTTKRTRLPSASAKANVKAEMKAEGPKEQLLTATPIYHPPIPRMHSWSTDPYVADVTAPPSGSLWVISNAYETPTMKRHIPNFTQAESPFPSSTQLAPTPLKADDTDDELEKDGSKLKGVYWPGMNLFDSATAEMKRMRNQKKDGTALRLMKRSSAEIEPTEFVFNADGELHKIRDIFDESTESSPDRSVVAPTPKKRRVRKGVLGDISTNAPRHRTALTKQAPKRAAAKRKLVTVDLTDVGPKKKARLPHLSLSTDIRFSPSAGERDEFRLAMGDMGKKRKFGIFRDVEDSPARTESPLEDHRFEFSAGRTIVSSKSRNVAQNSPTPVFKPVPMRFGGKETLGPGQMNLRLASTIANGFNPEIFHRETMNPLYTHSHAHSQAFSYGARQISQADFKPCFGTFGDDFKPLSMTDPFRRMHEHHVMSNIGGPNMADNTTYGM